MGKSTPCGQCPPPHLSNRQMVLRWCVICSATGEQERRSDRREHASPGRFCVRRTVRNVLAPMGLWASCRGHAGGR